MFKTEVDSYKQTHRSFNKEYLTHINQISAEVVEPQNVQVIATIPEPNQHLHKDFRTDGRTLREL